MSLAEALRSLLATSPQVRGGRYYFEVPAAVMQEVRKAMREFETKEIKI